MIKLKKIKFSTIQRLIRYIKPHAPRYLLGLIGSSLMGFLFSYIYAMGFKSLTDAALAGKMDVIAKSTVLLVAALCILSILSSYFIYLLYSTYRIIAGDIRKEVFDHIELLPMSFVENSHSADLLSRINNDMWMSLYMLGDPIMGLLGVILSGTLSGVVIFFLDWRLGLVALVMGFINTAVNTFFMEPAKNVSKVIQENLSKLNQILSDTIMGSQVIKIFNLQRSFVQSHKIETGNMFGNGMKLVRIQMILGGFNSFAGFMNFVGMTVIGSIMVINNQLTFGTLVAVTQLIGAFFSMFRWIGETLVRMNSCLASAERLYETMDEPDEEKIHREKGNKLRSIQNAIDPDASADIPAVEFVDINFGYNDKNTVLERFNLKVSKNQVVAVVGSSGSGKSTLFKLLLSFYEPDDGDIRFFGKSCYDYEVWQLRKYIAYVPQENYLFSGSIRENIGFGKADATHEEIIQAAKSAFAHEFIMKLPEGYDTEVGERGARLSGGERQRIAIARALLKNAPLLLLDEATSSLDSESEQQVQKALEVLMQGRTTMVIAHRLSTVEHADRIIVIDNGSVSEEGTHASLLEEGGIYAGLYNLQFAVDR
jgi:ATP-binding cassette subfamily B protein